MLLTRNLMISVVGQRVYSSPFRNLSFQRPFYLSFAYDFTWLTKGSEFFICYLSEDVRITGHVLDVLFLHLGTNLRVPMCVRSKQLCVTVVEAARSCTQNIGTISVESKFLLTYRCIGFKNVVTFYKRVMLYW